MKHPAPKRPAPRGQAMALFAFTIMLVTLMVMMTLGFGMKAKEKMELQHIADAAAYSNAITVARTLNGIAILNRAEVAIMVTMAANQSHISFASSYLGALNAIRIWSAPAATAAGIACAAGVAPCCTAAPIITAKGLQANTKYNEIYQQYYEEGELDHRAGKQARTIQGNATAVHQLQRTLYLSMQNDLINNQRLTREIVNTASSGHKWPNEYRADEAGADVNERETMLSGDDSLYSSSAGPYALSPRNRSRELGVQAAMGTRGNPFVANRNSALLIPKLNMDLGFPSAQGAVALFGGGSGHWTEDTGMPPHPPDEAGPPAPYASAADDEGSMTGFIGNIACPASILPGLPAEAWVYSTDDSGSNDDKHHWTGSTNHAGGDIEYHTMGECTSCPGVWVMFIDLNPDNIGADADSAKVKQYLWGQSKNLSVVRRNYNARCGDRIADWYAGSCAGADPWNLMFKFRFTPAGEDFDNRGMRTTSGANISNQIALGSGITYYHRPGYWQEPPNFFNPFWRATLVSPVVDSEGNPATGSDIADTVAAGGGASGNVARQVVNRLNNAGFKGW